ncbi:TlpA family protein disulfide reductase [[Pseudomonas] carboxydohydrogena]|uniref:TlpA family protein disulfide reductase n=1 Tax=Afipia carboxydohydrogena TaxID=290 RepID=A0ABY8BU87_AFICR|nr:TlpA disulfide reductase family protein [[Pseudomonas] carboxydohydrogena]WEF52424.1 TlpA family protein disulfide reductase [[Pseudomonas] carboxydohydrogena]
MKSFRRSTTLDDRLDESHNNRVATQIAPAGRGFRIGLYRRDIFANRGAAFRMYAVCSSRSAIYPKIRRSFVFQSLTRFLAVSLGAVYALVCLATSAAAGPSGTSQTPPPATLRNWSESKKPPFLLDDLHGNPRDLRAFAGKAVLVHFFATWCEPCVSEMASLQRLATMSRGKPLAIIAIDVAEVDLRVRAFFEKRPVDFAVLLDRDRAVSKSWDVTALPTTFVLDASLTPRFFIEGDLDWSSHDVLTTLETLYPTADQPQRATTDRK